jgi:hypothetical protein
MKQAWLAGALLLIAVSNAWLLAHVMRNRSGAAEPEVALTERELQFSGRSRDDSSCTLQLRWRNTAPVWHRSYRFDRHNIVPVGWFDRAKLREVGFDSSVDPADKEAGVHYGRLPARRVFVALEYDGPAWTKWLEDRKPQLSEQTGEYGKEITPEMRFEIERETESRLVAIDVGRDAAELRRRYPDRSKVVILPGVARVMFEAGLAGTPQRLARPAQLGGAIERLLGEAINVTPPHSDILGGLEPSLPWTFSAGAVKITPPRYSVRLRVGSLFEPWVVGVEVHRTGR